MAFTRPLHKVLMPRITAREGATRPLAVQSLSLVRSRLPLPTSTRSVQSRHNRSLSWSSLEGRSLGRFLLVVLLFLHSLLPTLALVTYYNTEQAQASTAVPCCYHNRKTLVAPSLTRSLTHSAPRHRRSILINSKQRRPVSFALTG